jgi:hypothetical protein
LKTEKPQVVANASNGMSPSKSAAQQPVGAVQPSKNSTTVPAAKKAKVQSLGLVADYGSDSEEDAS